MNFYLFWTYVFVQCEHTLFLVSLSPFTMVQITFISNKILEVYLSGGREMFLFVR